jgi:hypothetical protein
MWLNQTAIDRERLLRKRSIWWSGDVEELAGSFWSDIKPKWRSNRFTKINFTKINVPLTRVLWLTWYLCQVLPTSPRHVSNSLPVWATRPHLFFVPSLKGHSFTNSLQGSKPQIHQKWCQARTVTPNNYTFRPGLPLNTPNKYPKWPLKPVTGLSSLSSFVILNKGTKITKIDARLKPELQIKSYFGQVFPTTTQTCIQKDFSNRLLVRAPRLHLYFSLKGTDWQRLTPGSNQYSN